MRWVRQLIGRQRDEIVQMQHHEAEACLANGTVTTVTEDELLAAGIPSRQTGNGEVAKEEPPPGYRIDIAPEGEGYDVFGPDQRERLNVELMPNKAAARVFAHEHADKIVAEAKAALDAEIAHAATLVADARASLAKEKAKMPVVQQDVDAAQALLAEAEETARTIALKTAAA